MAGKEDIFVPLDTSWFDKNPEKYLSRPDFKKFEEVTGVRLRDLISEDKDTVRAVQKEFVEQSVIANEIQKQYFGFEFPFIVYTDTLNFFEKVPRWNIGMEKMILESDMGDSLRRRHIALSHSIIPDAIRQVYEDLDRPITIKNLGSGTWLDVINAVKHTNGLVQKVLNYDTNKNAVSIGRSIVKYLEDKGEINKGVIEYIDQSLIFSNEPADMIVKVGVICGMQNPAAQFLVSVDYSQLPKRGKEIISSSNDYMESTDPLVSFLIQHLGTKDDPFKGWGLNFRKKDEKYQIMKDSGFEKIDIYTDTDYPGKNSLDDSILYGVDTLPATVFGYQHTGKPLTLPPREILDRGLGYNWITVATK